MNPEQAKTHHPAKRRNLRQHIEEFSGNTTFHGVHFVLGADKGIFRRIFWLLLILTGVGFLTKQLVVSYQRLQSRDYVITKDIISTENRLKFPAVTICNANMMKKDEIKGKDAQVYLDQLNPFRKILSLLNRTLDRALDSSFDIEKAVLRYGHQGQAFIPLCAWDGEFCSYRNFTTRFSQMYGLCHTFNSGRDGHPLLYSTSVKRSRGLQMLININKDNYYGIMSYINTGLRMVIHDQDEEPMVEVNGINVMPDHITTIKIQKTMYISLPFPFKSACDKRTLKTFKTYTRSRCLIECNTRKAMKKCGCRLLGMPDLPEFNGSKYCTPNQMVSCGLYVNISDKDQSKQSEKVLFNYFIKSDSSYTTDNPESECDCPINCTHIKYKTTQINVAPLISDSYWMELYSNLGLPMQYFKRNKENFLLLIIQYDDLNTHITAERKAYDINDFGSDVGGYLGLFLGCSILTVFELFDFVISFLFGKQKTRIQVKQGVQKNENPPTDSNS